MLHKMTLAVVLVLLNSAAAFGQDWAKKMFQTTSHDFGTLDQGQKAEFDFVLENPYSEEVKIASVHTSCGCAKPEIKQKKLKPHEKGTVTAKFDTATFLGTKSATITVVFDKPFTGEVQLHLQAFIRGDTLVKPASVQFGTVEENRGAEKTINVTHKGNNKWQIMAIRSSNSHLSAQAREINRSGEQVSYEVVVRLHKNFPKGRFCERLIIQTNNSKSSQLVVPVEGIVAGAFTVSPTSLLMGVMEPGQKSTRQLVIQAKKPFRVVRIACEVPGLTVAVPEAVEKSLQIVPISFVAPQTLGKVNGTLQIETTLGAISPVDVAATVVRH